MSELDLIPPQEHFRVEALTRPEYAGRLSATLRPGERVGLATVGQINTKHLLNQNAAAKDALLVLTDKRLLAIPPRGKSLLGKVKEPEPIEMGFGNIFDAATMKAAHHYVMVQICGPTSGSYPGPYIVWRLDVGRSSAHGYGDVWAVNLMDLAEANGGTTNRPAGL
jgi:hypothetical protein